MAKKNKRSYDYLSKASEGFKDSTYKLVRRMIDEENFPERFFETLLCQTWKKKGCVEVLDNHRYLHMKDYLPKLVEMLTVNKMKPEIMSGGTKYQIGGIPGHCREEHLVVVKSIIQMFIGKKSKTCLRTGKPRSSQNEGYIGISKTV